MSPQQPIHVHVHRPYDGTVPAILRWFFFLWVLWVLLVACVAEPFIFIPLIAVVILLILRFRR